MELFFNKYSLVFSILILLSNAVISQDYTEVKNDVRSRADEAPSYLPDDPDELANYLTEDISQEWLKAYAIYYWVANNLQYDLRLARKGGTFVDPRELIDYALDKKEGVCQHYAELFHYLATQAGLESMVITGYTRQHGQINDIAHAWNAVKINGSWYLFDPTWGSGYIENGRVYNEYNEKWFMKTPGEMIRNHMPFDPLFQFLNKPLTNYDFYENRENGYRLKYKDINQTLEEHLSLPEEEQLLAAVERMKESGIINEMILREVNSYIDRINAKRHNEQVDVHNQAVQAFNEAVALFNEYIQAKNKQFRIEGYSDEYLRETFNTIYSKAMTARSLFSMVKPAEKDFNRAMKQNLDRLSELTGRLEKEKLFLEKYFTTRPGKRMQLFR
ncbi:MAG: transglutaminase domain-containing protein [Bacteroidota bacterium]|nr:transglutaminase domain-containing protein [Bacteroidota bacterium]